MHSSHQNRSILCCLCTLSKRLASFGFNIAIVSSCRYWPVRWGMSCWRHPTFSATNVTTLPPTFHSTPGLQGFLLWLFPQLHGSTVNAKWYWSKHVKTMCQRSILVPKGVLLKELPLKQAPSLWLCFCFCQWFQQEPIHYWCDCECFPKQWTMWRAAEMHGDISGFTKQAGCLAAARRNDSWRSKSFQKVNDATILGILQLTTCLSLSECSWFQGQE